MTRSELRSFLSFTHRVLKPTCLWALALVLIAAPAMSAPINYGNFPGATVDYLQVTEDANSAGDNPPLFGAPDVTGDSIDFDPVGFNASSQNGGADITDGQLSFTIQAKGNAAISAINFAEAGDTTLLGIDDDSTFSAVTTTLFIDVTHVDGAPINVVSLNNIPIPFSPSGGTYGMGTDGAGGPFFQASWAGSILVNVNQILTSNGIPFTRGATRVDVNLDNTLSALSVADTSSFIAKKNANGVVITVVPEPASCLLAASALTGLVVRRRRA